MQGLRQYSIQFKGLKFGSHNLDFEIGDSFFEAFPDCYIRQGKLNTELILERKTDHLVLNFDSEGFVKTECDRCTASIDLPIQFSFQYIVKFDEEEREEDEIVYIHPESHEINIASMLYEQILLAMPMIKVYDCEEDDPRPCNQEILKILDGNKSDKDINNPFGEVLKDLKITKTK